MIVVYYWPIVATPCAGVGGLILFQRPYGIAKTRPYAASYHFISRFLEDAISILVYIDLHTRIDVLIVFECYAEKYLYHQRIGIVGEGAGIRPKSRMPGEKDVYI